MKGFLTLLVLLLAIVLAVEYLHWQPQAYYEMDGATPPSLPSLTFQQVDELPRFALPALRVYREVMQRPLFSKDRRPIRTDRQRQAAFPAALELQGVFGTADERVGLFFDHRQNKKIYVKRNQQLAGWRVLNIASWGVILVKGPHQTLLRLDDSKTKGQAKAAPSVPSSE